jgi:hypothetical protein
MAIRSKSIRLAMSCCLLTGNFSWTSAPADAQASIAQENIIDDVSFQFTDAMGVQQNETVTLVRDAREENQWYYIPSKPDLVLVNTPNGVRPEFSFVKYDYPDPANPSNILSAGLLQFAARLSLPPEAGPALRAAVIQQLNASNHPVNDATLRVSALPINSAHVSLYGADNKLVGTADGTGIAPTFASQQMAFSMPLTEIGAEVFNGLINSPTGIRTAVEYKYNGLTPPAGFTVKVNYRQAHQYYSQHSQFRARASYYGLFSGSVAVDRQSIRDELLNSGAVSINIIDGTAFDGARLDTYLQPILKRINDEILEVTKPPERIEPAQATTPSTGGFFGGVGYSVAMKDVNEVKDLVETIDFRQQSIVERTTVAGGFIGIGSFPPSVKQELVTQVDAQSAGRRVYLALPDVPKGISRVDMSINLVSGNQNFGQRSFVWKPDTSWKDVMNGSTADRVGFTLAGALQAGAANPSFKIQKTIHSQVDSVTTNGETPAREATQALDLADAISGVRIVPATLVFGTGPEDLRRAEVTVSSSGKTKSYSFYPAVVNQARQQPSEEFFLLPVSAAGSDAAVSAKFTYGNRTLNKSTTIHLASGLSDFFVDELINP